MPISQTITAIPAAGHRGVDNQDAFVTKQEAFQDALTNTAVSQLNTAFGQLNTLETNVIAKEASAASSAESAANSATQAETSKNIAYATANFKGEWNSLTDFGDSSCEYLGFIYVSKVSPNVNHTPTDTNYWTALTKDVSIDEKVSHLSITSTTYNSDGTLATMIYTGGYKTIYTYSSGNLSTVKYTDTDGTTVLLTETMGYTNSNLTSITRS